MASGLLEWFAGTSKENEAGGGGSGFGIAPGVVKSNFNLLSEGRVQVHISAFPEVDPWARVVAMGGGDGRGFLWIPQIDDEVLVAFNKNDHRDAYVIGGLWSTMNRPPVISPTDFLTKRVLKTGMKDSPVGHSVEFDDLLQSVTITTSTSQKVTLDPEQIEVSALEGALTITLGADGIDIQATVGDLTLSAPVGTITLDALNIAIQSDVSTSISSDGVVSVDGELITLN
jgi:phage baseplate assembly protein gpV